MAGSPLGRPQTLFFEAKETLGNLGYLALYKENWPHNIVILLLETSNSLRTTIEQVESCFDP
jgi:hypothetical protein